ncbi:zinc finger MYM-type protein 1-like [Chenopodium quinoa]|uniref:zinc finger MYM-type protein 1-like n=1 Tax=Chenopodium quinoa TaxID=63459 RepID=UPI000B797FF8|nr:zinc finger MYM-type protein 1-like [Chenopodium quinoa]
MTKRTITSYFLPQKKGRGDEDIPVVEPNQPIIIDNEEVERNINNDNVDEQMPNEEGIGLDFLMRDPGLRKQIETYDSDEKDLIRRSYIDFGPYQPKLDNYPYSGSEKHPRRFQKSWFVKFPWLEYSPTMDAAYCFYCFLFAKKPLGRCGSDTFTVKGFKNWKKVNNGKDCAFLCHMGKDSNSAHNFSTKCYFNLKNQSAHIEKVVEKVTAEEIVKNRLRLKTSIDAVKWLTFQACAFRGHDERSSSINQGNFLEMLKLLASYNKDVDSVILDNAPKNAKYTSPLIQKEILHVYARKVQNSIREEIGDAKFCLIVDESRDISKKEQMALVVRYVDRSGLVRERFLDLVHVKDTTSKTLKREICAVLSHHNLNLQNIRGQGYDGASNMRGEWNGLQALFMKECPYAYYIHCLAHQLQLALVAASREVPQIHTFFQQLIFVVNVVTSSSKRHDELQATQLAEIEHLVEIEGLETGKGLNQIGTLQRPGDTRWSSHYKSISSLLRMYCATRLVLANIASEGTTYAQRGDALNGVKLLMSFEFVFNIHVVKEIMAITDGLCQALQLKTQDIVNAMHLVCTTKTLLQTLRNDGWESLLHNVKVFCEKNGVTVPDMDSPYVDVLKSIRQQSRQKDNVTMEHHYRVDIFMAAIDRQLQELNARFSERATELLILSAALNPRDGYKSFNIEHICKLARDFYPIDFTEHEKDHLSYELQHYWLDIPIHPVLKNLTTLGDLCQGLVTTEKIKDYPLVSRLIRLVLTLPASTATTERAFSAMKIVKTNLRSKMEDDFLKDYLIVYIEKEIAETLSEDAIIDAFYMMKERRAQLK